MVHITPETLVITQTLASLDGWSSWGEFANGIDDDISEYIEEARASSRPEGERIEDGAPNRVKKQAEYIELSQDGRADLKRICQATGISPQAAIKLAIAHVRENFTPEQIRAKLAVA